MSIVLVFGPMFSGKTTTLLSYEKKFQISNKLYVCINHSFDTRYTTDGKLATHDGKISDSKTISVSSLNEIEDEFIEPLQGIIIDNFIHINRALTRYLC
jgi:thymidine kinase